MAIENNLGGDSIIGGTDAADLFTPTPGMTKAQSDQIAALRVDAATVAGHGATLTDLINQSVNNALGQVALNHDTIDSGLRAKLAVPVTMVTASGNKIASTLAKGSIAQLQQTAQYVPAAGLAPDFPPWERQLYAELSPTDALRVSSYLRSDSSLTPDDKAALAASVIGGTGVLPSPAAVNAVGATKGAVTDYGIGGPIQPVNGQCPPDFVLQGGTQADGTFGYTCVPTEIFGPPPASPPPPGLPVCEAHGPCGECSYTDRGVTVTRRMGPIPAIHLNGSAAPPTDAQIMECRFGGYTDMQYVTFNGTWTCSGTASVFDCGPTTPPPPIIPPPPLGGSCPTLPPPPISLELPPGYVIMPGGMCVAPPAGGGGSQSTPPYPPYPPLPPAGGGGGVPNPPPPPQQPPPPAIPPAPNVQYNPAFLDDPTTVCAQIQGAGHDSASAATGDTLKWIEQSLLGSPDDYSQSQGQLLKTARDAEAKVTLGIGDGANCPKSASGDVNALRWAAAHWSETATKIPYSYFVESARYAFQYSCPQYLVSQEEFDDQFNAGLMTDEQWTCYTRSLGNLPNLHRRTRDLKRTRPDFISINMLYNRGDIDESEFLKRSAQLGITDSNDLRALTLARVQNGSFEPVIHWMRRKYAAGNYASSDGLETGFAEEFSGIYYKWLHAEGISKELALEAWKNQWVYPTLGETIEMNRRFRGQEGSNVKPVTAEDIGRVALMHGIAPGWVDRIVALAAKILTRQDLTRAYNVDAVTREELVADYRSLGYDADDAEILAKVADTRRDTYKQSQAARISPWSPKSIMRAYVDGSVSMDTAVSTLEGLEIKPDDIATLLQAADASRAAEGQAECVKGYRRQFLIGAVSKEGTQQRLYDLGVSMDIADSLVSQWGCQMLSRSRELGAEKNVAWFLKGILSLSDLSDRLQNLGYSAEDTSGYIQDAMLQQQAALLKAQKAAAAEEAKLLREKRAAERAALAEAAKEQAARDKLKAKDSRSKKRSSTTKLPGGVTETDSETVTQPVVLVNPE